MTGPEFAGLTETPAAYEYIGGLRGLSRNAIRSNILTYRGERSYHTWTVSGEPNLCSCYDSLALRSQQHELPPVSEFLQAYVETHLLNRFVDPSLGDEHEGCGEDGLKEFGQKTSIEA